MVIFNSAFDPEKILKFNPSRVEDKPSNFLSEMTTKNRIFSEYSDRGGPERPKMCASPLESGKKIFLKICDTLVRGGVGPGRQNDKTSPGALSYSRAKPVDEMFEFNLKKMHKIN